MATFTNSIAGLPCADGALLCAIVRSNAGLVMHCSSRFPENPSWNHRGLTTLPNPHHTLRRPLHRNSALSETLLCLHPFSFQNSNLRHVFIISSARRIHHFVRFSTPLTCLLLHVLVWLCSSTLFPLALALCGTSKVLCSEVPYTWPRKAATHYCALISGLSEHCQLGQFF